MIVYITREHGIFYLLQMTPPLLSAIIWFFLFPVSIYGEQNITIDDTNGDTNMRATVVYHPPTGVTPPWDPTPCSGCTIQPEGGKAVQGTWTALTVAPDRLDTYIEFRFNGMDNLERKKISPSQSPQEQRSTYTSLLPIKLNSDTIQ
jgi:hypothetical protein